MCGSVVRLLKLDKRLALKVWESQLEEKVMISVFLRVKQISIEEQLVSFSLKFKREFGCLLWRKGKEKRDEEELTTKQTKRRGREEKRREEIR